MTREELAEALDRYGGDLARWPEEIAAAAHELVARDRAAADDLAAAKRLDGLLGEAAREAPVDAAVIGRIMSGIGNGKRDAAAVRPTGRLIAWASGATLASLALGFAVGIAVPEDIGNDAFAGLMFDGPYAEDSESVL